MVYLTVSGRFNAFHTLWHPSFTREENFEAFGECANPAGHGHEFRVELTFCGPVSADKPVVVTRETVRHIFDDLLAPRFDGKNLNTSFGDGRFLPTGENLAQAVWALVEGSLDDGATLSRVKIVETRKNSFSYAGGVEARRDDPSVCPSVPAADGEDRARRQHNER